MTDFDIGEALYTRAVEPFQHHWIGWDAAHNKLSTNSDKWEAATLKHLRSIWRCLIYADSLHLKDLHQVWMTRHLWGAGGSAPGHTAVVPRLKRLDDGTFTHAGWSSTVRLTKKAALESLPESALHDALEGYPGIVSSASIKHENRKDRLLLNTQIEHYILSEAVLAPAERALQVLPDYDTFNTSEEALEDQRTKSEAARRGDVQWMWDYADFNLVHSQEWMSKFWRTLAEGYEALRPIAEGDLSTIDQLQTICEWLARAEHCVTLKGAKCLPPVLRKRGLLSGERGTSVKNTVGNMVYARCISDMFYELFGYHPFRETKSRGDDLWSTLTDEAAAAVLYRLFNLVGLPGQGSKLARFGEFLRLSYTDGTRITGHLNRSIAGYVSRSWQTSEQDDPTTRTAAHCTQLRHLQARGLRDELAHTLWHSQNDYLRSFRVMTTDATTGRRYIHAQRLPADYFATSVIDGGAGVGDFYSNLVTPSRRWSKAAFQPHLPQSIRYFYGSQMTNDYWTEMHRLFPQMSLADPLSLARVKHAFNADNIMGSLPPTVQRYMKHQRYRKIEKWVQENADIRASGPALWLPAMADALHGHITGDVKQLAIAWRTGTKLYQWGESDIVRIEKAISVMPCKRYDVFGLWVDALRKHVDVSEMSAILALFTKFFVHEDLPGAVYQMQTWMTPKIAAEAIFGRFSLDSNREGSLSPEFASWVRNAAWCALERITRSHRRILTNTREIQISLGYCESIAYRAILNHPILSGLASN
jgi:hypothetical protein